MAKKKKADKLINVSIPKSNNGNNNKLYDIKHVNDYRSPCIGFTYLDVNTEFGLKGLFKQYKSQLGNRNLFKELDEFLLAARNYKNIEELITNHISHNKAKSNDEKTRKKANSIKREYNIETCNIIHIHCKRGGNGEFVLHGFVIQNCFEVLFIDPMHSFIKSK